MTFTAPLACAGVTQVICVELTTTTLVAGFAPKDTKAPAMKFVPVIVTAVPPPVTPELGLRLDTVGTVDANV